MDPPPAPTVWMSMTGMAAGCPAQLGLGRNLNIAAAQRHVGRGSAHVEGEDRFVARAPRPREGAHHAARGTRQDRVHRLAPRPLDGERAPVGPHDGHPAGAGVAGQTTQVAVHDGRHVGVHDRGGGALVLAELGQEPAGDRHRHVDTLQGPGDSLLVAGIGIRVEEADRDRLGSPLPDLVRQRLEPLPVEGDHLLAFRTQPAGDAEPVLPGHQGRQPMPHERVELRPVLAADLDDVLEALVGHEDDPGPPALEERVGGDRGSMEEHEVDPALQDLPDALQHGPGGVVGRGGHLQGADRAAPEEHQIGEGAARIHGEKRR